MNADLSQINAATEPTRFLNAAVLSPDDVDMDASDAALHVLLDEEVRLSRMSDCTPTSRLGRRLNSVQKALRTLRAKRKVQRPGRRAGRE